MLEILKTQGGSKVTSSVLMGCGDTIAPNGSFVPGVSEACDAMTLQLSAIGIGAERVLSVSVGGLETAFKAPEASIAGFVALAKAQKLRGFSSDIEARGSARHFACYLSKLRAALRPLGVRLTMYNNAWDSLINDVDDLQHGVDRLLDGDTCEFVLSLPCLSVSLSLCLSLPVCFSVSLCLYLSSPS